jgi:hypothetical protein
MPPNVEWKEPALLWKPQTTVNSQPRLLELKSDEFMPEFLAAMGQPATRTEVPARDYMDEHFWNADQNPPRLYLPLHQRYYLVTGSLVCRVVGMPDKLPDAKAGEKVGFVVRRLKNGNTAQEQSFVEGVGWKDSPLLHEGLLPGEERFPLHPVKVCTGRGGAQCERHIFYGYVATGAREKYIDKVSVGDPNLTPSERIKALFAQDGGDVSKEPNTLPSETNDAGENITDFLDAVKVEKPDTSPNAHCYVIRFFYEYDRECPAIVSTESRQFVFARPLEIDAPARIMRIEMPSLGDFKKFRHGVGIQMPADLRNVVNKISPKLLSGGGLDESIPNVNLQMICTFSVQIITIIALILMMTMAILLNIALSWLPFLKVCIPIPEPE